MLSRLAQQRESHRVALPGAIGIAGGDRQRDRGSNLDSSARRQARTRRQVAGDATFETQFGLKFCGDAGDIPGPRWFGSLRFRAGQCDVTGRRRGVTPKVERAACPNPRSRPAQASVGR